MAVLQGDPSKAGEEFTVRLRLPSGYKIAPHTHPTAENITVIEGTFLVGMGSTFDKATMMTLPRGAFASAPAEHAHYAEATRCDRGAGPCHRSLRADLRQPGGRSGRDQIAAVIRMQPARRPFNLTRVPSLYPTLHMSAQQSSIPALADALTARVQSTWTSGDFGRIARSYERGAAEFIARLELEPGDEVLDVACGTGNLALPAARAGATVTGSGHRAEPDRAGEGARGGGAAIDPVRRRRRRGARRTPTRSSTSPCRCSARCSRRVPSARRRS